MARLILTFLGGFRARLDPASPVALPTRKAQALLAYLAVPLGVAHPRDKLASLLWGNAVESTARTSLRQTLYALRKSLAPADPLPLRVERDAVSLDPDAVTVDVHDFEARAAEATSAALVEAAALYQGGFLEGLAVQEAPFEDWLVGHRERLRERAVKCLAALLASQRTDGATETAVQTALRLLELDPLQEPVHRTLMELYVETGRRGAALRQYQLCVATLQRELRMQPEEETKALYHEILRRRSHVPADAPSAPQPAEGARPRSASALLPEPPPAWDPPLVGRQRDVARLVQALDETAAGRGRLVALIGEAGAGKSRLVSELTTAARQRGRVLVGRCYETERILPFAPWVNALRAGQIVEQRDAVDSLEPRWRDELARLLPELSGGGISADAPPGGETAGRSGGDPRYPFEAISELLKRLCERPPLVVVLEDAHWADDMSVRLLAFLGRRLHQLPLLLVVTIRDEELADVDLLRQSLEELDEPGEMLRLPVAAL